MAASDRAFDELAPPELRHLSESHWTPIDVAIQVATLLAPTRNARVLDIGSGIGKVCSVGALSSSASWFGVEQHEELAMTAERLARGLGVSTQTTFLHGDAFTLDWTDFDALYLYNPFEVPLFPNADEHEHALEFALQVTSVEKRLAAMPVGTRVVTYHGFGGVMPASYELVYQERVPLGMDLAAWVQSAQSRRTMVTS
jgi:SAM-dependent methyltransferase